MKAPFHKHSTKEPRESLSYWFTFIIYCV